MNKPITRLFRTRTGSYWFSASGDAAADGRRRSMDLCRSAISQLWDIPRGTRRIWITVSTKPTKGESYRLRREYFNAQRRYNSDRFPFDGEAQLYLGRRFDTRYIYATMEYE